MLASIAAVCLRNVLNPNTLWTGEEHMASFIVPVKCILYLKLVQINLPFLSSVKKFLGWVFSAPNQKVSHSVHILKSTEEMWFVVLGEINKTDLTWSGMKNSIEILLKLHHSNGWSCIFLFFLDEDKMCHNMPLKSLRSIFVAHKDKNLRCTKMKRHANSVTN